MKQKKYISVLIIALLMLSTAQAQTIDMADGMRADGKIYVVIAIAFFVLAVMSIYMISIDRRIRKMENKQK